MYNFFTKRINHVFVMVFLVLVIYPGIKTSAENQIAISEKSYPSISRDWEDISLLYNNMYHNSSEVNEEIDRFNLLVPELIDIDTIGYSFQGKDIRVLRITNENRDYQKAQTLVVSHHHGREQITVESALRFILYLLNNYQENSKITEYLDYQEIFVIPTVNPDALDIVVDQGDYWLRKNLHPWDDDGDGLYEEDHVEDVNMDGIVSSFDVYDNTNPANPIYQYTYYEGIDNDLDGKINEDQYGYTDLNRNYDSYWRDGNGWEDDTLSQIYPGPTPFSEPETQAVRNFMLQHNFGMAYSLHSGTNATLFTDGVYGWVEPSLYWNMVLDYRQILPPSYTDIYFEPNSVPQSHEEPSAALAGSWDTWAYFERNVLAPITFEIYNNLTSILPAAETVLVENSTHLILEWKSIYGYFTPEDPYIVDLWQDILPAFTYLLDNTPRLNFNLSIAYIKPATTEFELTAIVSNLSPRIKTMEGISIYNYENNHLLASYSMILADTGLSLTLKKRITDLIGVEGDYPLIIGNDYVGYREFLILTDTETLETNSGFMIGFSFLGVVFISILAVFYKRNLKFM